MRQGWGAPGIGALWAGCCLQVQEGVRLHQEAPLPGFCSGCTDSSRLAPGPAPTRSERGWVPETLSRSSSS